MSTPTTTGDELCPSCGVLLDRAEGDFCSGCGTYIPWPRKVEPEAQPPAGEEAITVRQPGEAAATAAAAGTPPGAAREQTPPSVDVVCPACATPNPPTRTLCRKCGVALTAPRPTSPAVEAMDAPARGLDRLKVAMAALAVAALVAVVVVVLLAQREPGEVATQVKPSPPATSTVQPTALESARVRVEASSTLANETLSDGTVLRYDAALTLDGDPTTAWNHGAGGDGTGEVLTYTFDDAVALSHVVVVNGFALSEDLFRRNARMRDVVVTTDAGKFELTLRDTRMPQQVEGDFGRTRSLRVDVASVYPGEEFEARQAFGDLALSEIGFFVEPGS